MHIADCLDAIAMFICGCLHLSMCASHVFCRGALDIREEVWAEGSRKGFGELPGCSLSIESRGLERGLESREEMCSRTRRQGSVCVQSTGCERYPTAKREPCRIRDEHPQGHRMHRKHCGWCAGCNN